MPTKIRDGYGTERVVGILYEVQEPVTLLTSDQGAETVIIATRFSGRVPLEFTLATGVSTLALRAAEVARSGAFDVFVKTNARRVSGVARTFEFDTSVETDAVRVTGKTRTAVSVTSPWALDLIALAWATGTVRKTNASTVVQSRGARAAEDVRSIDAAVQATARGVRTTGKPTTLQSGTAIAAFAPVFRAPWVLESGTWNDDGVWETDRTYN